MAAAGRDDVMCVRVMKMTPPQGCRGVCHAETELDSSSDLGQIRR